MVGGVEIDKDLMMEFTSLFKFYIDAGRYSVVDRFAYAISPVSAVYALYEAIREARSALDRAIEVKYKKEDKEYSVKCCEYEEYKEEGECKWLVGVAEGSKTYCCLPCPHIPSDEAVAKLVELLRRDVSVATKIAAMAMAYRARRE
jgi:CRISPR-associated protein, Csa5 family